MAIGENSPCFEFIKKTLGTGLVGVEIGIWDGGNAEAVLDYIKPKKYYMVDPYRVYPEGGLTNQMDYDAKYAVTYSKFSSYANVSFLRMPSEDASKIIESELDFVYIDGAHDYRNKMLDLRLWYDKVRVGGIICGDDYEIPSVTKAVKDFSDEKNISFEISIYTHPHPIEYWSIKNK